VIACDVRTTLPNDLFVEEQGKWSVELIESVQAATGEGRHAAFYRMRGSTSGLARQWKIEGFLRATSKTHKR